MERSVINRMIALKESLPKKQRTLCSYIVTHYSNVAMMTVAELATGAEVGTTTVMRLMQSLGYSSYQMFRNDLMKDSIIRDSSSYSNMRQSLTQKSGTSNSALSAVTGALPLMPACLLTDENIGQFEQMVQLLLAASTIYVVGFRSSFSVAQYFQDSAHLFLNKLVQLSASQEFLYDTLLHMEPSDVVFVVSEWPCTKKTVVFSQLCHKKGIPVVLLTNTSANPIMEYAAAAVNTNSVGVKAGRLPAILVVEALVQELGRRTTPKSIERLNELEEMLRDNGILMWD